MVKYRCTICGYVYDSAEENMVEFEDLPEDWSCPICGVGLDQFEKSSMIRTFGLLELRRSGCAFLY